MSVIGDIIAAERKRVIGKNGKPLSQLDLALKIGWENPSTISRIESGVVIPNKETVIKIFDNIEGVSQFKLAHILIKSGYFETKRLTFKYVKNVTRNIIEPKVKNLRYPINVVIYSDKPPFFITYYTNSIGRKVLFGNGIHSRIIEIISKRQDLMEIFFNPMYKMNKIIVNWEEFVEVIVTNLHILHNYTDKEEKYIKGLYKYPKFKFIWKKSSNKGFEAWKDSDILFIYKVPCIGHISFKIHEVSLLEDRRFFIEHFIPATAEDVSKIEELYKKYRM